MKVHPQIVTAQKRYLKREIVCLSLVSAPFTRKFHDVKRNEIVLP